MHTYRLAMASVLFLAALLPHHAATAPPSTPLGGAVVVSSATTSIAKVDGKWIEAETRTVAATVAVECKAKWVQVRVRKLVTVTIDGQTVDVLSAAPVEVIEITADKGRLFGVVAGEGRYQVEVICSDPTTGISSSLSVLVIGAQPQPEPPGPGPTPSAAPFKSDGFAVLILKEASKTGELPEEQRGIFTSPEIHRYAHAKCVDLDDGGPFYRQWDDDYDSSDLANAPKELQQAYRDVLKQADGELPWIAISTGDGGYSGPLPGNVADTLKLLKKYGG